MRICQLDVRLCFRWFRSETLSDGVSDARQFTFRICFCVRPSSSTRKALVLIGLRFAGAASKPPLRGYMSSSLHSLKKLLPDIAMFR